MSQFAKDSAIRVTPSLEQEIADAKSTSEITAALHRAALSQGIVEKDPFDKDGTDWSTMHVVERPQPRVFAKTLVVDGKKYILECDSEAGLAHEELVLMRQLFGGAPAATTDAARDERGRFVAQPTKEEADAQALEVARQADLQLKFQLGQIDAPTFIRESGAVDRYLSDQGIDVEDLKAAATEKQEQRHEGGWKAATDEFLQGSGANWPGGQENLAIAGRLLQENGLADKPSAENLAAVWQFMQQNNLAVEGKEGKMLQKITEATSYEDLKASVGYRGSDGSGLWGR